MTTVYSDLEFASYPGVTNIFVTRFLSSGGKPDMDDIVK